MSLLSILNILKGYMVTLETEYSGAKPVYLLHHCSFFGSN